MGELCWVRAYSLPSAALSLGPFWFLIGGTGTLAPGYWLWIAGAIGGSLNLKTEPACLARFWGAPPAACATDWLAATGVIQPNIWNRYQRRHQEYP